ncbi:hypothetical protein SAMN02745116_02266 [Pilibacter termitis]|uniref:ABC-2 family transporter protein n=1 Tax=Pilibacter termitis TaxID=263852 RepID=A0A1T4QQL5_9ENTE|nr:hypothetical protein [Pilibacter termitis]SKA05771.1 hypothetical protein SAMN02745116_02266 [Pilibacter termitis]
MNYFNFLSKKVFKSKLSWVPVIILFMVIAGMLFLNNRAAQQINIGVQTEENITRNALAIEEGKAKLKELDENSEHYTLLKQTIAESTQIIEEDKVFLKNYNAGNWKFIYPQHIKNMQKARDAIAKNNPEKSVLEALDRDLQLYRSLAKTNLTFENSDFPVTTIQYLLSLFRYTLPILLTLSIVFILSNLYGSTYYESINKSILLPQKKQTVMLKNIVTGVVLSLLLFVLLLSFAALISSIFFGFGSVDFPILHYQLQTREVYFAKVGGVILPTLILQMLSIVFIVNVVFLITSICKNKMTSLFLSGLILVAGVVAPKILQPLQTIAQYIPTAYLNSFDIVTGTFQKELNIKNK